MTNDGDLRQLLPWQLKWREDEDPRIPTKMPCPKIGQNVDFYPHAFCPVLIRTFPQASKNVNFYPQKSGIFCRFWTKFSRLRQLGLSRARLTQKSPNFCVFIRILAQGILKILAFSIRFGIRNFQIFSQFLSGRGQRILVGIQGSWGRARRMIGAK